MQREGEARNLLALHVNVSSYFLLKNIFLSIFFFVEREREEVIGIER